jgi:hypothetical protein
MSPTDSLEDLLIHTRPAAPPPELRQRVLAATRTELQRERQRQTWRVVATTAAACALWLHLSWSAVLDTRPNIGVVLTTAELDRQASEIQRLIPDLPPGESRRQALLMNIGLNTTIQPLLVGAHERSRAPAAASSSDFGS